MGQKFKTILTYGAIISLLMILMSVIAYVFDISDNKAYGWVSMIVFIASVIIVQKYYSDGFCEGHASYKKLFGGTILMIIVAALIMFFYTFVFYKFVAPEQIDKLLEVARANLYEQEALTSAQINQSYEYLTKYVFTPFALSITTLLSTFGQGLVFSLITTIFMKSKAGGFEDAMRGINETTEE
ncbi:MAG: DUF4199 domain-containing protein [Bacteroidales bacterium]|nr:DUF4199 domain-containing protein [Bacteroidales bacterium]MDY0143180.1 DUF4199 domain-containing protein [Bacteroidales bacterium]